jgi:hypothetical protein
MWQNLCRAFAAAVFSFAVAISINLFVLKSAANASELSPRQNEIMRTTTRLMGG